MNLITEHKKSLATMSTYQQRQDKTRSTTYYFTAIANHKAKEDLSLAKRCLKILTRQPFFKKLANNSLSKQDTAITTSDHSLKKSKSKQKSKLSSFEKIQISCSNVDDNDNDSQTTQQTSAELEGSQEHMLGNYSTTFTASSDALSLKVGA